MTIRQYRAKHDLTKAALARLLGVNRALVGRWENGENRPTGAHIQRILEVTEGEVTVGELVSPRSRRSRVA